MVRPSQISFDIVEGGRSADSTAADHQTCGACRIEAGDGRSGINDVAVRDDWDVDGLDDLTNLLPIGCTGVPLSQGSAVNADSLDAFHLKSLGDLQCGVRATAGTEPDLGRDRHLRHIEAGSDHLDNSIRVPQKRCSGVVAADLGCWASEVDVDDVGPVLQKLDGLHHLLGDTTEDLRDEGLLAWIALDLQPRVRVSTGQAGCRGELGDRHIRPALAR